MSTKKYWKRVELSADLLYHPAHHSNRKVNDQNKEIYEVVDSFMKLVVRPERKVLRINRNNNSFNINNKAWEIAEIEILNNLEFKFKFNYFFLLFF